MVSPLFFYPLVLIALVWLCVMLQWAWPSDPAAACPPPAEPVEPAAERAPRPQPHGSRAREQECPDCLGAADASPGL